jgi:hypothetical protein
MIEWLNPAWLIWCVNMAAAFAIGNAYGQDKIRIQMKVSRHES